MKKAPISKKTLALATMAMATKIMENDSVEHKHLPHITGPTMVRYKVGDVVFFAQANATREQLEQHYIDHLNAEAKKVHDRMVSRGAKLFKIDGRYYWAMNERNAMRKHDNYLKSKPKTDNETNNEID